jgi:carbonic anhydrase/acetyltransferase-like protein (isoleucine patch superfamily)
VWFGAVLRGDNEPIVVRARSNIQELCVMHTDMGYPLEVGEDCTVGHSAVLHGCTLGAGSLIGMGSVVLNGARIGRGCLIGARALVTEGKSFADHTLVIGSPAKAVRTLNADEIAGLIDSARHYVEKWRQYLGRLKRIDGEP